MFTIFGQVSLGKTVLGESTRQEYKSTPTGEEEGKKGKEGKSSSGGGGGGTEGGGGGGEESESVGQSLNLEVKHIVKVSDPQSLDELVRNPLLGNVLLLHTIILYHLVIIS